MPLNTYQRIYVLQQQATITVSQNLSKKQRTMTVGAHPLVDVQYCLYP